MYTYIYVHIRIHITYKYVYTYTHIIYTRRPDRMTVIFVSRKDLYTHIYKYTCIYIYMHTYIYLCDQIEWHLFSFREKIQIHIHVQMYVYIYTHIHTYIKCTCVYIYTYTHTSTYLGDHLAADRMIVTFVPAESVARRRSSTRRGTFHHLAIQRPREFHASLPKTIKIPLQIKPQQIHMYSQ